MNNNWKEVVQELQRLKDASLSDIADEIVTYDKKEAEYRAALADKALRDYENGDLVTVSKDKLKQVLDGITDCRICPLQFCEAKRRRELECIKRLLKWMADEWDEGIYPEDEDA